MKKYGMAFGFTVLAVLFVLAGYIVMIVSHMIPENGFSYAAVMFIVGVVAILDISVCSMMVQKCGKQAIITYLSGLVGMMAVGALIGLIVFERAYLASALFTWDSYNANGWSAFYTSIACVVLYFLGASSLIISGFCQDK